MQASLNAINRKLGRAKEKLTTLRGELDAFDAGNPYEVTKERDSQGGLEAIRFKVFREPDLDWEVTVGEIAYQVRSLLDQLVTQLVILKGGDPNKHRGSFPIYVDSEDYWKKTKRGPTVRDTYLKGVRPKHKAIIDGLQPYQRGERMAPHDPLAALNETCKGDKHRYGHPGRFVLRSSAFVQVSHETETITVFGGNHGLGDDLIEDRGTPIDDGADLLPILRERIEAIDGPVEMDALRVGVAFGPDRVLCPDLERIIKYVEERVVARFEPFF